MSSTIEQTSRPGGHLDVRPHAFVRRFQRRVHGRRAVRGRVPDRSRRPSTSTGLRGAAQASSIDVDNDQLAEHLASPDFFDVGDLPRALVRGRLPPARTATSVTFEGILEVKGNRAPITLTGTITDPVSDPWGNSKLGLSLAGTVDKNAVGLTWNAPLPEGGSMLADEVELDGDARLRRRARGASRNEDPRHRRQPPRRLAQRAASPPRGGGAAGGCRARRSTTASPRSRRTTMTSTTSSPDAVDALKARSRRRTRPRGDARVQRLGPGSAEERARLGLPTDRGVADPRASPSR